VEYDDIPQTEILFAAADAAWQAEIVRLFGAEAVGPYRERPEGRGAPGSLLRDAWTAREHAYAAWRTARGLDSGDAVAAA